MDDMLEIPKNRKPRRALRLTVALGLTVLMFLLLFARMGGPSAP